MRKIVVDVTPFQALVNFSQADLKVTQFLREQNALTHALQILDIQEKHEHELLETARRLMIESRKAVDAKELDTKIIKDRQKALKVRLENAANPKEYFAVEQEIKKLEQELDRQEELLYALWEAAEQYEKKYYDVQEVATGHLAEFAKSRAEKQELLKAVIAHVEEKVHDRDVLQKLIPLEWQEKYASMREHVDNPMVPVAPGDVCSGCYYTISVPDMLALRRNKLLQCKNCFRFLYSAS